MRTREQLIQGLTRDGIGHIQMQAGDGWMIVAPELGARIMGAGIGDENLLWTAPRFSAQGWGNGGNVGGARTWIGPEAGPHGFFFSADGTRWRVPQEIDPGDYRTIPAEEKWVAFRSVLTSRAADASRFPLAITRSMHIEPLSHSQTVSSVAGVRILLRQEIQNVGETPVDRRVSLWCIVQVPSECPSSIFIPVRIDAMPKCVQPYFGRVPEGMVRRKRGIVAIKAHGGVRYKLGVAAEAASGTISFVRPSQAVFGRNRPWTIVSLRFAVDPRGTYLEKASYGLPSEAQNGDAIQAYNDSGTGALAFSEIEAHAPARRLEPGDHQSFEIEIRLLAAPQFRLAHLLRSEIALQLVPSDLSW
jgi:hypothetical protein